MVTSDISSRIVAAVGEAGAQLLDVLIRSEADRAALIGRLSLRADGEWLAELLIDLVADEPARDCGWWRRCGHQRARSPYPRPRSNNVAPSRMASAIAPMMFSAAA